MSKLKKLYEHILMRRSDANVPFETLCSLLKRLGFDERMKWEHHIFTKDGVDEIIIFGVLRTMHLWRMCRSSPDAWRTERPTKKL